MTDLPPLSSVTKRALALTGCDGIAAMAAELMAARGDLAQVTRERDALAKRWESAQEVYAAMLDDLNALRKRMRRVRLEVRNE